MGAESRIARLLEARTARLAAGVVFLAAPVVAREMSVRRKTAKERQNEKSIKLVELQELAEENNRLNESGVVFIRGKSRFLLRPA